MQTLLTKYGIPTKNLMEASDFLNAAEDEVVQAFNAEFGFNFDGGDALTAACFAADAILRGAENHVKVVGHVARRMTGMKPVEPRVVTVVGRAVETPEVVVAPVVNVSETQTVVVKGKRGRKRLGNSDFDKVIGIIQSAATNDRKTLMDCIVAEGISKSSANVYLWRYFTKGER